MKKPVIALTMGDPCGIGPEIIVKALTDPDVRLNCIPLVLGDRRVLERALSLVGSKLVINVLGPEECPGEDDHGKIFLRELSALDENDMRYGAPTTGSGMAVFRYITEAASLCMQGKAAAIATAPINKAALNHAGHHYPGHTELLAELTGASDFVMMLAGDRLRVALVTIHEAIEDVPRLVTFEKILATIRITHQAVGKYFCSCPRIAVLALNPHCGEGGLFGSEEERVIVPAINAAREEGINVKGPFSADTLFHRALQGNYDAVVCMYHDQGLIPLKLIHFDDGVNITLGLPIIRTSVDHGTAYDLAGKGVASAGSMAAAIRMAAAMANFALEP